MSAFVRALSIACLVSLIAAGAAQACSEDGREGILPENTMRISVYDTANSNIDEATYNAVIDKVQAVYAPVVSALGATLNIERKWGDDTVNSYAHREGSTWLVDILGGLARHSRVTPDALALVVCHELGHHLGGAPRFAFNWAAVEGEADYFAALKCMKTVFDGDAVVADPTVPAEVAQKCQATYPTAGNMNEERVCERTAMAALALGELFADLGSDPMPAFDTPDTSTSWWTYSWHPAPQCRLDTYWSGALCSKDPNLRMGGADGDDPTVGACSMEEGDTVGYRPLCWYKPKKS